MKRLLVLAGIAVLGLSSLSSVQAAEKPKAKAVKSAPQETTQTTLVDREKSVWEAFKNKQDAAFSAYFASDYTGVYDDGIKNVNAEVTGMHKMTLRDYSLADTKVVFADKDCAVMTYKVTVHGSMDGKDISGAYNASSVWANRGGKWTAILHTEVKAAPQ